MNTGNEWKRKIAAGAVSLFSSAMVWPVAASADTLDHIQSTGAISICSVDALMPYSSSDPNEPGYEAEIAKAIGKHLGAEVEFVWVTWDALIPALNAERCDIISDGMFVTEERKKVIDFSVPYLSSGESILVRQDNDDIKGLEDLRGKTTAVLAGAVTVDMLQRKNIGPLAVYPDQNASLLELNNGRVDAAYMESPAAGYAIRKNTSLKLKLVDSYVPAPEDRFNAAVGIRKGDERLLAKINEVLGTMTSSGEIEKIVTDYGVPFFPPK